MSTQLETALGKFVWHESNSTDVEAAKSFYTTLFGWELEMFPGEMEYAMVKSAGRTHGGFTEAQDGAPSHWLPYVFVENVDETAEKAKSAGGTVMDPFDIPEVGRMAVVFDPQGAVFSIIQPAGEPDAPPAEGVFVWDELMTTDVEAAKAFYGDVLGWTSRDMDMGEMTYTIFERAGGGDVGGCMARPEGVEAPPHWLAYIATGDADATVARAKELGANVFVEPTDIPNVGRFAVLQDPTGATFCILQGDEAA